jgi:putative copper export protein/mono/diheme cytochrome c family protein
MRMTGLVLARTIEFASGALALGIPTVLAVAILPALGRADGSTEATLVQRLVAAAVAAAALQIVAGLVHLFFEAAEMSGRNLDALDSQTVETVLRRTRFGHVLLIRLALATVLALWLSLAIRPDRRPARQAIISTATAGAIAAADMAAAAWSGHAAASAGVLHLFADAAHLIAAGIWLGGLVALVGFLSWARRGNGGGGPDQTAVATRRFSQLGLMVVGTLLGTGLVNSWFLVGTIPALVGTDYGMLLLCKLGLFLLMVALATFNRFWLTPRLCSGALGTTRMNCAAAARWLRRSAVLEAVLGFAVVAIVGGLGLVPPGAHEQPQWPFSWRFSTAVLAQPTTRDQAIAALTLSALGAALFLLAFARRRTRLLALPTSLALLAFFTPRLQLLTEPAYPTSFAASPVPYTTRSIATGQHLYLDHCTTCHGMFGKGNGPAATSLPSRPADLTAAHVLDHREGDLFWWLSFGISGSAMPGFADRLTEDERWDLVNFVRTLPIGGLDEGLVTEVGGGTAPRAPDFTFSEPDGRERSLQDLLRNGPVLLVLFTLPESTARLQRLARAEASLGAAGLQILALPSEGTMGSSGPLPDFVAQSDPSVTAIYRLIAAPPGYAPPTAPPHIEILIDREGFARAAWRPDETIAWSETNSLVSLVRQLATRRLAPASSFGHQHGQ